MKALYRLTGYTVLTLALLAGCGGAPAIPAPPSASKAVTDLTVTAQRELEIEGTRLISLSPDGQWLVATRGKAICIVAVETLADKHCIDLQTGSPDVRALVWSPDSKRLVFTEDLMRFMLESDVWLLDIEGGQLTNLTPDEVTGGFLKQGKEAGTLLDAVPGWSPDGQTVIFSRSDRAAGSTSLYRLSIKGGTPEKIIEATSQGPLALWYSPRWLGNNKLVYTVLHPKLSEPANGIWLADSNGQNARQLLAPDPKIGPPALADVSPKSDYALVWYPMFAGQYGAESNVTWFALLDLNKGESVPLKPAGEFMSPANARFSPDGSKLAYVYRTLDKQVNLVIRDVQSGAENTVLTQSGILGANTESPMQGLDWANNDTLYAATGPGVGVLLTLGSE
ncbi:hypothetical protein TFLX_00833 [Thermoflexales bacterium]|nr:hypothetical protein TFLX_00833 [Thermoflexales bacterium]